MTTQLIFGVAGAIAGSFVGQPGLGFMLGSAIGGIYSASQAPDSVGPRLTDLTITQDSFGQDIPRIWGTVRLPGTMIWCTDIQENSESVSAKGGPEVQNFTYTFSAGYVVCEGPVEGITRIWANKRLIFDMRPESEMVRDMASISTLRIYTGTETQDVDALAVAMKGPAPAYRGYVVVVFEDFKLTEHYGNHPPQFEFEVVEIGAPTPYVVSAINFDPTLIYASDSLTYNVAADVLLMQVEDTSLAFGTEYVSQIAQIDPHTGETLGIVELPPLYNSHVGQAARLDVRMIYDHFRDKVWVAHTFDDSGVNTHERGKYLLRFDAQTGVLEVAIEPVLPEGEFWLRFNISPYTGMIVLEGQFQLIPKWYVIGEEGGGVLATYQYVSSPLFSHNYEPEQFKFDQDGRMWFGARELGTGETWLISLQVAPSEGSPHIVVGTFNSYKVPEMGLAPASFLQYDRINNSLWVTGGGIFGSASIEFDLDTFSVARTLQHGGAVLSWSSGQLAFDDFRGVIFFAERNLATDESIIFGYDTDPSAILDGGTQEPIYTIPFHYVANGVVYDPVRTSLFLTGLYPASATEIEPVEAVYRIDFDRILRTTTTLDIVVRDICLDAGMVEADIDVTELVADIVVGYSRPRNMTARDQIEPLMVAYYFDPVESDDKIKFVKRGQTSNVTIPAVERAAHEAGQDMPSSLKLMRTADLEMPWEIQVRFVDIDVDLQPGTAYARRLAHNAQAQATQDLPIVMTQAKADEIAQTQLYSIWRRRVQFEWTTTRKYDRYEPTDLIVLPTDEEAYDVRVTQKRNVGNGIIEWTGVEENVDDFPPDVPAIAPVSIASSASVGTPSLSSLDALGDIVPGTIFDSLLFEPDSGVYYNWFFDYGVRTYVPERDEWWLNGYTDDPGFDDDGTWYIGQEIVRYPALAGASPSINGFTAIPLMGSPVLQRTENVPYPVVYDATRSVVWANTWGFLTGGNYTRNYLHKIDATTALHVAAYPTGAPLNERVFGVRINPHNGDIWLNYSGSRSVLRLFVEGSPTIVRSITMPWNVGDTEYEVQFEDAQFAWIIRGSTTNEVARIDLINNTYATYDLTGIGGIGFVPVIDVPWPPGRTLGISTIMYNPDRHSLWVAHRYGDQFLELGGFTTEVLIGSPMTLGVELTVFPQGTWNRFVYDPVAQHVWFGRYLRDPEPPYEAIIHNSVYVIDPATGDYTVTDLTPFEIYIPSGIDIGIAEDGSARIVLYAFDGSIIDENDDEWTRSGLYQLGLE